MIESRFIAFADMLGFRSLVLKSDLKDLATNFDQWVNQAIQSGGSIWSQNRISARSFELKKIHFSDTVVLLSPSVVDLFSPESKLITKAFFMVVEDILLRTLLNGFPLRMGVSFGPIYLNNDTLLGKPVIHAYDVEQAQDWIGGAVHPDCPISPVLKSPHRELVPYDVPLKKDARVHPKIAINWTYLALWGKDFKGNELPFRKKIDHFFKQQSLQVLSPDVEIKYLNTQKFWEHEIHFRDKYGTSAEQLTEGDLT